MCGLWGTMHTTVKPLMFACPLFREFHVPNKTAKLKGANINCMPKIGRNYYSISNYMVLICQNKGAKIILHAKLPTFRAAKLKGLQYLCSSWVCCFPAGTCDTLKQCLVLMPVTCELDTMSRTGTEDFCQSSTPLLQSQAQNLKHSSNVISRQNMGEQLNNYCKTL